MARENQYGKDTEANKSYPKKDKKATATVNNGVLWIESKELFELNKKKDGGQTKPYNKAMFDINNYYESNLNDAIKNGWNKFKITASKNGGDLEKAGRNVLMIINQAVSDRKRENALFKVYGAVNHAQVDVNSDEYKNVANKYALAKILNNEGVDFKFLDQWCENQVATAENKEVREAEVNRHFDEVGAMTNNLADLDLLVEDEKSEEGRFFLANFNGFVRTELCNLTLKDSVCNADTLKQAVVVGNEKYNNYKEQQAEEKRQKATQQAGNEVGESALNKYKNAYNNKDNKQQEKVEDNSTNVSANNEVQEQQSKSRNFRRK